MLKIPLITPDAWIASKITRAVMPLKIQTVKIISSKMVVAKIVLGSTAIYHREDGHHYVMDNFGDLEELDTAKFSVPYNMATERKLVDSTVIPMDDFGNSWHYMRDPLLGTVWITSQWGNTPECLPYDWSPPGEWRVPLGVPVKPERGWNILHQYSSTDNMAVVRWLNLYGECPSDEPTDMVEFEMLSGREVAAESFPLEIGSLLARRRFVISGESSVGLVYDSQSTIRQAYVGDCESYFDEGSQCLIASDKATHYEEGGWDTLRKVWDYFSSPERWNVWYTEVFVQKPQPVAVVFYGKTPRKDYAHLIREFEAFGLPVIHLDPCWEN